jgi:glycine cleavage system H protein
MSTIAADLKYAATHEWARLEGDGTVTVGITDHAQYMLGDIVFIELPEVGRMVEAGEQISVVESVKTASDIHAPLSGTIAAVNPQVTDNPEHVNNDAYATWLFKIQPTNTDDLARLLDADGYRTEIGE